MEANRLPLLPQLDAVIGHSRGRAFISATLKRVELARALGRQPPSC